MKVGPALAPPHLEVCHQRPPAPERLRALLDRHRSVVLLVPDWREVPSWHECDPHELLGGEHARYLALSRTYLRTRFLCSRWLLAACLAAIAPGRPPELRIEANGRPVPAHPCGIDLNLSHTDHALAVGLSRRGRVGVDIEPCGRDLTGLASRLCTPTELRRISCLGPAERSEYLGRLWTLKEAHGKALGSGLAAGFTGFGLEFGEESAIYADACGDAADWTHHSWRAACLWVSTAVQHGMAPR